MDDLEIRRIIEQLDSSIPKEGGEVEIYAYGGGIDESAIAANKLGFLRLAVELMKCAYNPHPVPNYPHKADVRLDFLFTKNTDVRLDYAELREDMSNRYQSPSPSDAYSLIIVFILLVIVGLIVLGLVTVVKWLF